MANSAVALRLLNHTSLRLPLHCCHLYPLSCRPKPSSANLIRRCRSLRVKASATMVKAIVVHEYGGPEVERGHTVLVHAAAGGVGSLLCQWANALGAIVIGTVSSEEKAAQATEDGCHHVIIYTKEDFVTSVNNITSGKGVNVVYDSVGKDTFQVERGHTV